MIHLRLLSCVVSAPFLAASAEMVELPADKYQDRVRGAWAGQVVGAACAAHGNSNNQASANLKLASTELGSAAARSFFHVQIAFLQTMEKYGRTATRTQAGVLFRATEFALSQLEFAYETAYWSRAAVVGD